MEHKICFTGPFLYCVCGRIKHYAIYCGLARFWPSLTKMLHFTMQVLFWPPHHVLELLRDVESLPLLSFPVGIIEIMVFSSANSNKLAGKIAW